MAIIDFVTDSPLVQYRIPQFRVLYIGSYACATLLQISPRGYSLALLHHCFVVRLWKDHAPSCYGS